MNTIALADDQEEAPIAMGGMSIPGSVGFSYARVAGAAPSKGKYAKKTMASAQNGIMSPMLLARNVLNYFYPSEEAAPTVSAAPVEYKKGLTNELLQRQAYKESTFNPAAVSPAGYKGLTQIGEGVLKDYSNKKGGKKLDPFNPEDAVELQKFAMDDLYNASFINKPNQSDSVRIAKTLAAYNWGRGNLSNYLNEQKSKGVDIYDSYDWLNNLPKETSDYVNKILLQEDPSFNKNYKKASTNPKYEEVTSLYDQKKFGGDIPFAQNGQEMRFYQNGLDWKPKSMQNGGDEIYQGLELPEFVVEGKDERMKEAMSQGIRKFYAHVGELMGAPQKEMIQLVTGKEQTPSEAFGFQNTGGWLDNYSSFGKNLSNFAMDAVLDPVNLLGVGIADDIARTTLKGSSKKLASSANDVSKGFKSEINWAKWNKEIPENTELMKEYNAIEQASKANNTWMKNPDGSKFKGTPEQFVQENSKNFKNSNLNSNKTYRVNTRRSDNNPIIHDESSNIAFTGDEKSARPYILGDRNSPFLSAMDPPSTLGLHELYATGNKRLTIDAKNASYDNVFYNGKNNKTYRIAEESFLNPEINNVNILNVKNHLEGPMSLVEKIIGRKYGNELINKQVSGNYLKSARGNNGMFDMTNPNIYKGVIPAGIATALSIDQQKNGGVTKDNQGYWNPDNWGKPVEIDSNDITMEGVYEPLLGVSDTGDTKLMKPGKNYKFKGKKVTEYPVAQWGEGVPFKEAATPTKNISNPLNLSKELVPYIKPKASFEEQKRIAKLELDKYGYTSDQRKGYVKGRSEKAFRNITPQDYGDLTKTLDRIERYEKDLGRNPNETVWYGAEDSSTGKPIYYDIPKRDDAFALYLGLPQKNKSFGISEYQPGDSKENKYYFKPNYLDENLKNRLVASYFGNVDDDKNTYIANERGDAFPQKTDSLERAGIPFENPMYAEWMVDNPLGDFKMSKGKDEKGHYVSIYDVWDLNPFKQGEGSSSNPAAAALKVFAKMKGVDVGDETEMSNLFGAGKPFEIYDRIYYDPKTKKVIPQKRNGGGVGINQLDAQPMKKLNQLLNFTNNPDKDNWLDKYN
jgi:soluble lytic murein transglycosylase-like protein